MELLRDSTTGKVAAELAAVVLRNLALGNAGNRDAIVDAHGLAPLLGLLSAGQEWLTRPMPCEVGCLMRITLSLTATGKLKRLLQGAPLPWVLHSEVLPALPTCAAS